jgi:Leucine-rich repeat (LRR) protein
MHHLVESLKGLPSLSVIDLSQNELSDQGALYLKGLLEKNNAITDLRVDGNKITSRKRLAAIADGLRYNNSVLKTFGFSATTSLAIFQTVDALEDLGGQIGATVSEAVNA